MPTQVFVLDCVFNTIQHENLGGHNKIITLGSIEEQMVADHMESGLGLTQTASLINNQATSGSTLMPLRHEWASTQLL